MNNILIITIPAVRIFANSKNACTGKRHISVKATSFGAIQTMDTGARRSYKRLLRVQRNGFTLIMPLSPSTDKSGLGATYGMSVSAWDAGYALAWISAAYEGRGDLREAVGLSHRRPQNSTPMKYDLYHGQAVKGAA